MAGDQREPTKERLQNKLTDSDGVRDELDLFHIQVSADNSPDAHMDKLAQEVLDTNQEVSVNKGMETFVGLAAPDSLRKNSSLADMDLAPQDIKDAIQLTTVGVGMQLMGPVLFAAIAEEHPDRKTTGFDDTKVSQTLEGFDITSPALLQPFIDKYKIALSPAMKSVLALLSTDKAVMPQFVQEYIKSEYAPTIAVMKTSLEHLTRAYTEELTTQSDNTSVSADDIPVVTDGSQTTDPVLPSSVEIPVIISSDDSQQGGKRGSSSEIGAWGIPLRKDLKGAAAKRTTASDLGGSGSGRGYGTGPLQYTQSGPDQFGKSSRGEDAAVYAASVGAIVGGLAISAGIWRTLTGTTPPGNTAPLTTPPTTTTSGNTQPQGFFRRRWPWLATAAGLGGAGLYYFTKGKKPAASSTPTPTPAPLPDQNEEAEASEAEHTHDHSDHNHDDTHTHTHDEPATSTDEGSDIPVARPTVEGQTTGTTGTASTESSTDDRGEDLSSELAENTGELDVNFLESKHASVTDIYKKLSLQHGYKTDQQALIVDTIEQKMYVVKDSKIQKEYDISTAYNIAEDGTVKPNAPQGISSVVGSNGMPAGVLEITGSRGKNAEKNKVLVAAGKNKDGNPIHKVTTQDADPSKNNQITSRVLYLGGKEESTKTVRSRGIYIHGTNQENLIGQPASNGSIRMKNDDIIELSAQITGRMLVGITDPTEYGYVLTADRGDGKRGYKK